MVVFALIGDLVGSRRSTSRSVAQAGLETALRATSAVVPPVDRLETTVGDEFQGVYADLGRATLASLLVRLNLPAPMDARCGIGVGEREVYGADRTPMLQDGEAWWGPALRWRPSASRRVAAGTRRTTIGTPWARQDPPSW